jgi:leader peptidase (prepilin peptidase)/N-methyltransferase
MTTRALIAGVVGAAVFATAATLGGADVLVLARLALLGGALATVTLYDLAERRIPNRIVLPAATACAGLTLANGSLSDLAAAAVVVLVLAVLAFARPQALGMGDVKLAFLIVCGLDGKASIGLILGLALAAIAGLLLTARHGRRAFQRAVPLAPFLTLGALASLLA